MKIVLLIILIIPTIIFSVSALNGIILLILTRAGRITDKELKELGEDLE
jgi:hypothetical protein